MSQYLCPQLDRQGRKGKKQKGEKENAYVETPMSENFKNSSQGKFEGKTIELRTLVKSRNNGVNKCNSLRGRTEIA